MQRAADGGGVILIADIKRTVAKRYRVPLSAMDSPGVQGDRQRRYVWPRQVAMTLAVRLTEHSYPRIGHFFGHRHHTTVLYACKAVEQRRKKNARLHNSLRSMTLELVRR